ncbi:hypothetical protein [Heliothis virescens ascovirus 3e]|uniref:Uncharacterized protein n=2 Tax=Ascovirus hvav3a TaxID=3444724 RepID=A4KXF9_HVAVE|nr:hypothetical protein HVAV3e_gp103 [Heliothis virescens ascovirus 3e]YP_009702110.1 hypothetical protein F8204_gp117 [Heliothis virescens ascovirus 3g]ABO37290.1 hypothetical protein [Heliothis virescens ascovirus 3e]AFV50369.1 hypothetical protein [Heliothis virescens ascovirus 3g]
MSSMCASITTPSHGSANGLSITIDSTASKMCWWDTRPLTETCVYTCPVRFKSPQRYHIKNGYRFNECATLRDREADSKASVEYVGAFCGLPCVLSWAMEKAKDDPIFSNSVSMINSFYAAIKPHVTVGLKPAAPREILVEFGGSLSIDEYRAQNTDWEHVRSTLVKNGSGMTFITPIFENVSL